MLGKDVFPDFGVLDEEMAVTAVAERAAPQVILGKR
jgi:hypothetical protein